MSGDPPRRKKQKEGRIRALGEPAACRPGGTACSAATIDASLWVARGEVALKISSWRLTSSMTVVCALIIATPAQSVSSAPHARSGYGRPQTYVAWPQFHFNARHTGFNRYEGLINADNVATLVEAWHDDFPCTMYGGMTVAGGMVFVGSYCRMLYAFDESTGALRWSTKDTMTDDTTPAVGDGLVFVGGSGGVEHAYDATTGARAWTYPTGPGIYSSTAIKGKTVYFGNNRGDVFAVGARDGVLRWRTQTGASVGGSPAVHAGVVFVGSADSYLYALDARSGTVLWQGRAGAPISSESAAVTGGMVYVSSDDGRLLAFSEAGCGASVCDPAWTGQLGAATISSPAVAYGDVYVGADDGDLYAFDSSGCGGVACTPLWTTHLGGEIRAAPAVANGVVYATSCLTNAVYAVRASDGGLLWSYSAGTAPYGGDTSPSIANGTLFVAITWEFRIHAFRLP
jgi:outer membrane protein assembly factor BamB